MNFFDTYDIAREPTPQPSDPNQPTLNEEVNQLVGQIGRFWGGFKRQSQQVLEVAKKDLGDVVIQAQKEIGKLTVPAEGSQPEASTSTAGETTPRSAPTPAGATDGTTSATGESSEVSSSSATDAPTTERSTASDSSSIPASSSGGLFSRLQSALPPNLLTTVQSHIPESIKHASENIDISQVGANLLTEFQRVQGVTRAQAEEYARKSEALIREAVKEANEVLKDAVKIIPPDPAAAAASGSGAGEGSGIIWDGSDMWMLPNPPAASSNGKEREVASAGGESQHAVASRAIALLQRLRSDPSIIQHDPAAEGALKEVYVKWVEEEVKAKGGFGSAEWAEKTAKLLKEETTLYEMYTSLVPSTLSKEEFWSRYFFRAHQITHEEERRKALIQAHAAESDEDFSWEDDDDDHPAPAQAPSVSGAAVAGAAGVAVVSAAAAATAASISHQKSASTSSDPAAHQSPITSEGSAESFDLLSSTNASVAGDVKKTPATAASKDDEEEDDSEEEDEDDEEESDSDWE